MLNSRIFIKSHHNKIIIIVIKLILNHQILISKFKLYFITFRDLIYYILRIYFLFFNKQII